jgi:hypothetical protein
MEHLETHRAFVSYIDCSREYYVAQGYAKAYAWPRHDDVPFTPLPKPLSQCRVGLVTTATRPQADGTIDPFELMRTKEPFAEPSDPPPAHLYTADLGWDKEATHTDDLDSFLPVNRMSEYAAKGRVGSMSPRFYGVPTDYSQRRTIQIHAPKILEWCREDGVDAMLLSAL